MQQMCFVDSYSFKVFFSLFLNTSSDMSGARSSAGRLLHLIRGLRDMLFNCLCSVRIHDLQDLQQMYDILKLDDAGPVSRIEWTDSGQLLAVSTRSGSLHVYLTQLPIIGASYMTCVAYLTSVQEVMLQDCIRPVRRHLSGFIASNLIIFAKRSA